MDEELNWTPTDMLEVTLKEPDDFLKVRETLSRIGVASRREKKLWQSCTDLLPIILVIAFFQLIIIRQPFPDFAEIQF